MPDFEVLGRTIDEKLKKLRSQELLKKDTINRTEEDEILDQITERFSILGEMVYEAECDSQDSPYNSLISEIKSKKGELEEIKKKKEMKGQSRLCPVCGAVVKQDALFCSSCGSKLSLSKDNKMCPSCGAVIQDGDKFCGECGATLL